MLSHGQGPMKGAQMTEVLLRPYRALRHPPQDALAFQAAYLVIAAGAVASSTVHDVDCVEKWLAVIAAFFSTIGGTVGWASQYRGIWMLERGAIWLIWGGMLVRSSVVVLISDASPFEITARVAALVGICLLLLPRYRSVTGADRDPHK